MHGYITNNTRHAHQKNNTRYSLPVFYVIRVRTAFLIDQKVNKKIIDEKNSCCGVSATKLA
jgi:hypothetical protein